LFGRGGQGELEAGEDKPHTTRRTNLTTPLHGKKAPLFLWAKANGLGFVMTELMI